jgi:hypothetical protein
MEERLSIPMYGGETVYTYAWRGDSAYLCMEERLGIPMCGGKTVYSVSPPCIGMLSLSSIHRYTQSLLHA